MDREGLSREGTWQGYAESAAELALERQRQVDEAAARFGLAGLVGRGTSEVRRVVEAAGGIFVDLGSDEAMTADVRVDRVLADTKDGVVTDVRIA